MTNKKNVLYIGGFRLPDKNAAAQRVMANGKLFNKVGYNVTYIDVDSDGGESEKFLENTFDEFKYLVKSQKYPQTKNEWFSYITNVKFIINAVENDLSFKPDIIVVYNYPAITLLKLTKYCKKNNIKIIADITEWYFPEGSLFFKTIKGLDSYFRMHYLHKKLDGVIVISKYLENFYKDINLIRLPPLVDKNSMKWDCLNTTKSNFCKLIYVGSISHGEKDRLDFIINSLKRIKDSVREFKFIIIGVGKSDYIKFFGEKSLPDNIDEFVSFLGKKPHKEVIKHIKNSDYSIFLRSNNLLNTAGFPTKFVESIACGTPVLTNDSSDISEYLLNGEVGYFLSISNDKELDVSLVEALSRSKDEILKMKNKSSNFNRFHYEIYEDEFIQFLTKI
jgi:glycosyltransferase involved in cell wall biosynthesis